MSIIYERVMELCKKKTITKTQLEHECGFSQNSINKWESRSYPAADKLLKVADYFGVSVDYLLGRDKVAEENAILANKVDFDIAKNYGADYIEKIYKELDEKQKVFVISWLVGYAKSQGIQIKI